MHFTQQKYCHYAEGAPGTGDMEKRWDAAFGHTILHDVCALPKSLPPKPDAPVSLKCSPIAVLSPQSTALPPTLPRLASCHLCPKPCRVECGSPVLG